MVLPVSFLLGALLAPALAVGQAAAPEALEAVTRELGGFRDIRLGMSVDEVKAALAREPLFSFRGDPDVSLLPASRQVLIEVPGRTFVERGYFQFHDGRLLVMIVVLAREEVSYFEVYTTLCARYGAFVLLDPSQVVWQLGPTRVALEKPVVLKYVDSRTFDELTASSRAGRDYEAETLRQFLDSL